MSTPDLLAEVKALQAAVDRLTAAVAATAPGPELPLAPSAERAARITVRAVAARLGVPELELRGRSRLARVALGRHIAITLTKELSGDSLEKVGRVFHRDHGTVAHSVATLQARCETDPTIAALVDSLLHQLRDVFHQPEAAPELPA